MIKERIFSYAQHIPLLAGVEATFTEEGVEMQVVLLKQKGSAVSVLSREAGITTVDKLLQWLPKDVPLVLTLNGKGVIHRFLPQDTIKATTDLLRHILPNAKQQDFYLQECRQQQTMVVSLIRKERLAELLAFFAPLQNHILSVSLGPFPMIPLLPMLKEPEADGAIGHHRWAIERQEMTAYQWEAIPHNQRIVHMGDEEMNAQFLVAFSLALLAMGELPLACLPVAGWEKKLAEKRQQWFFKRSAILLGSFFLVVLLMNTYYFLQYSQLLAATPPSDASLLEKEIKQLNDVLKGQEQLVSIINYVDRSGKAPLSYLADQLGASVPNAIHLDAMEFFPKDEAASRKERKPVYQTGTVQLSGSTATIEALNHWVKAIGLFDGTSEVKLVDYRYDEKTARGLFNLNIRLRP